MSDTANGTRTSDSGNYLRVPEPLKVVRGFKPSPATIRVALRVTGWALLAWAAHWVTFSGLLQTRPFLVSQDQGSWQLDGLSAVRQEEIDLVFAGDVGRSLASVNLSDRWHRVQDIPWVRSARVSRVWPNTISVTIEERVPIAFLRLPDTNGVRMVDSEGVILDARMAGEGSLPVLTGIDERMPFDQRRRRIELFRAIVEVFSQADGAAGRSMSEVDVSDARNAVVLARHRDRMVELQMGDRHLQHRLEVFLNYIDAWHSEFGPVEAVDLRFEKQVAVRPAQEGEERG